MRLQASQAGGTQRAWIPVTCRTEDAVGDVVYITGDMVGIRHPVARVDIDDPIALPGIGVLITKETDTLGVVQLTGLVDGVYSGLVPNRTLFVGTTGRLQNTPPPRPSTGKRYYQVMARAVSSTRFLIQVQDPIIIVA